MFRSLRRGKFAASQPPMTPSLCALPNQPSPPDHVRTVCGKITTLIPNGHIQGYRERRLKLSRQMSCCWKLSRVPELSSLLPSHDLVGCGPVCSRAPWQPDSSQYGFLSGPWRQDWG